MILAVIIIFTVFQFGVYHDGKIIMRELNEESAMGIIPQEHLKFLPYTSRRFKRGWLQGKINQKEYVKTATKLALRKHQARTLKSSAQVTYLREVEILRTKITSMLYYANNPS